MDSVNRPLLARLAWFLCLGLFDVNNIAVQGARISAKKDAKLEYQLKLLNKPAIKTIETEYGDTYDCVDFYQQPAFDHPLLKNHAYHYEMKPSSVPPVMSGKKSYKDDINASLVKFKSLGCPLGTVPIRRVTKDDLIRAHLNNVGNQSNYSVQTPGSPGTHYSVVRTIVDPNVRFKGGGTYTSIYSPGVQPSQTSLSRIVVSSGTDSVEGGWTVNPGLFGDGNTRWYVRMKTSTTQCFNTQCGFVMVNQDIALGSVLTTSQRGVLPTWLLGIIIYKDANTGDWWLGAAGVPKPIGFWPKTLFTSLADLATAVEFGGEVTGPPDVPSCPMGSGEPLENDMKYDAYHRDMSTISESRELIDVNNTEVFNDDDKGYRVIDAGTWKQFIFRIMFFGGPGQSTGN